MVYIQEYTYMLFDAIVRVATGQGKQGIFPGQGKIREFRKMVREFQVFKKSGNFKFSENMSGKS